MVAPAGSYRSGGGGNETVGAFETDVSLWRCSEPTGRNARERRAGLETSTVVADLPLAWGRPPSLGMNGETGGIGRPTSDQNPAGHWGNDDGMSVHGDPTQHGKGAIPKRGDFDSAIRSLSGTICDNSVEDPRSAFNSAGKIHLPTTFSGESSVSENLAPVALPFCPLCYRPLINPRVVEPKGSDLSAE